MKRLFAIALAAAAGACSTAATSTSAGTTSTIGSDASVAEQAARADSIRNTHTPADVAFMQGMIHHHAQAVVMSGWAPTHGASESLQIMAARIINAQDDEIALMERWLRTRGEPVPDLEAGGGHAMGHGDMHGEDDGGAAMPGMLTDEQMANLEAARGEEFDRLFLTYMIQHHQGALTMVEELVATPGGAREQTTFKLASDIGADQHSEVVRMQTMLRELLFSDGDTP